MLLPLRLHGIVSYFLSRKLSYQLLNDDNKVLLMMSNFPWNVITDVYSRNDDIVLDYRVNMVERRKRVRKLISGIEDNCMMEVSVVVSEAENINKETFP